MFDPDQLNDFHTDGFVRLPAACSARDMEDMRLRLWDLLEARGSMRNDPATWQAEHGFSLQDIRKKDPDPCDCAPLVEALDLIFGTGGWSKHKHWGQALVTFPSKESWRVPHRIWHFDWLYNQAPHISGVNVFLFFDDVEAGGGGTVVLKSSPALVKHYFADHPEVDGLSEANRGFGQSHDWLQDLNSNENPENRDQRLMKEEGDVRGVPARIVELIGKAGDIIVCHPSLYHAPATNASDRLRMMRVQRFRARQME